MDAVVLVGGEGTRLRPLTLSRPKPMLPLLGLPLIEFVLDRLASAGVTRVIFGCGYLPDPIASHFGADWNGVELEYVVEPEPMGTAGGIRFAAHGRVTGTFLALNGDILADAPLADLVAHHRERGARATIALTPVDDPSRYGLVRIAKGGSVLGFLEKPKIVEIDTNLINAGAYVLEPSVLDLIEQGRAVSIERETFPLLVGAGLFALEQGGYWSDVGTPVSYVAAHHDLLAGRIQSGLRSIDGSVVIEPGARIASDAQLVAPAYIAAGATVAARAYVGAGSTVADGASVGVGASISGAVLHEGASVGDGATVAAAVVGRGARIGAGSRIGETALIGDGVEVPAGGVVADQQKVPG